jgi:hypothetical protein
MSNCYIPEYVLAYRVKKYGSLAKSMYDVLNKRFRGEHFAKLAGYTVLRCQRWIQIYYVAIKMYDLTDEELLRLLVRSLLDVPFTITERQSIIVWARKNTLPLSRSALNGMSVVCNLVHTT